MSDQPGLPIRKTLKPEQSDAAYTLDRHVSVTAGPGSGKTTVLVERYLGILKSRGVSVDQIVAITFTNRAANEMRVRLRRELDKLLQASEGDERRRWLRHKRTLDGAVITTIHGFCSRLLREYPLEAGLDPQFALLEEHQSAMLEEAMVDEVLSAALNVDRGSLTRLVLSVGKSGLAEGLLKIYRAIKNQGLEPAFVRATTLERHTSPATYTAYLDELDVAMGDFIGLTGLTPAAEKKRVEAQTRWPGLKNLLAVPPTHDELATFYTAIEAFRDKTRPSAAGKLKETVQYLDTLIWEKEAAGKVPQAAFDTLAAESAYELVELIEQVDRRVTEEKVRISALGFDDLQIRTLNLLKSREDVLRRIAARYSYFLVDEFQDTNWIQQALVKLLALGSDHKTNLFVVGDPKQSVYGFRGADVSVFESITGDIKSAGGASKPLNLNFRSQPQLIGFFNHLFARVFETDEAPDAELSELGYVWHEASRAERQAQDEPPLIELHVDIKLAGDESEEALEISTRERDAAQVAGRIQELVGTELSTGNPEQPVRRFDYRDISMLFRAMTDVGSYESALRRAGIPYRTVAGKGFYQREEINDLIQLLRFLDNTTDEIALAAVMRSPLCGLSDNALLALRCAPLTDSSLEDGPLKRAKGTRGLFAALKQYELIQFLDNEEYGALEHTRSLLTDLIRARHRCTIPELLRLAVARAEYLSVVGASFDGSLRIANVEKLFTLAERFSGSGAVTVPDFVRFVFDFERRGGRESEGAVDESLNAVTLMTIHQSKGLEFPVVILPDLHRNVDRKNNDWFMLDRHCGLTVQIPDGLGGRLDGLSLTRFRERAKLRERFESMRLLYVAATRAEDRLILTGAASDLARVNKGDSTWLSWIWKSVVGADDATPGTHEMSGVQIRLELNRFIDNSDSNLVERAALDIAHGKHKIDLSRPLSESFPLLPRVEVDEDETSHRLNVTQLLTFSRCPRQYYFRHGVKAPENSGKAADITLTAAMQGAVIHRFCEKYDSGGDVDACLLTSLRDIASRWEPDVAAAILADEPAAIRKLKPYALKYLISAVYERIEQARNNGTGEPKLAQSLSEQRFTLRRQGSVLTGTIDKLLITGEPGNQLIEIIDFKTERVRKAAPVLEGIQANLFDELPVESMPPTQTEARPELQLASERYRLQIQAYTLAVRQAYPDSRSVKATLLFLAGNEEYSFPDELLTTSACESAVDEAAGSLMQGSSAADFPPVTGDYCHRCGFIDLCGDGRRISKEIPVEDENPTFIEERGLEF